MNSIRKLVSFFILIVLIGIPAVGAPASDDEPGKLLLGTWKVVEPAKNTAGRNCPTIPEMMTFLNEGTVLMSYMPGRRMPFKIDLTAEEQRTLEARDAGLKGRKLLLVKPTPQTEWSTTPIVYSYMVTTNELTITVTGWSPAKFRRVQ